MPKISQYTNNDGNEADADLIITVDDSAGDNKNITLGSLKTFIGRATTQTITQAGIAVGEVVLQDGTGAQADTEANAEAVGIVQSVSGNDGSVVTGGKITLATGSWPEGATAGDVLYISPTTAGALTKTAPTTNGDISKPMVVCLSTSTGVVTNYRGSVVSSDLFAQAPLMHVREELSNGASPASSSASTWNTRALQTTSINQISGASLASNVVTLPAGTYYIEASAEAVVTDDNRLRIRKTSGTATTLLVGPGNRAGSGISYVTPAIIQGRFTLSETSDIELQHYTESAGTLGEVQPDSEVEVYSELLIWKVG